MSKETTLPKPIWRWLISVCLLIHFGCILLTLSTNRRRSNVQDSFHSLFQPYLVGLNWYQEMLPLDWISGAGTGDFFVAIQTTESSQWTTLMPGPTVSIAERIGIQHEKTLRMVQLLAEMTKSENHEGAMQILRSIISHLDASAEKSQRVQRIRVQRKKSLESMAQVSDAESISEEVVFEVSIARFADGTFGLVPKIEVQREVRAIGGQRSVP